MNEIGIDFYFCIIYFYETGMLILGLFINEKKKWWTGEENQERYPKVRLNTLWLQRWKK